MQPRFQRPQAPDINFVQSSPNMTIGSSVTVNLESTAAPSERKPCSPPPPNTAAPIPPIDNLVSDRNCLWQEVISSETQQACVEHRPQKYHKVPKSLPTNALNSKSSLWTGKFKVWFLLPCWMNMGCGNVAPSNKLMSIEINQLYCNTKLCKRRLRSALCHMTTEITALVLVKVYLVPLAVNLSQSDC